jgi:sugar (pentulose or hexulose) kinase
MGERSPIWDAKASGAFVGLGLHHGREHLYRAVLEGISYALRHNIDTGTLDGQALDDALTVVGGASRSDLWMQIIADVTGRPVRTLGEDVEASLGAAMLAALGVGLIDRDAVSRGWVRLVERARPEADARERYAALYAQYLALYPALKPVMHALRG